ncbi:MAG TPA: rhomboid family intramembrane serine protease [Crocinitomicaceae bacterium]|jgi:membrane associated rhomboid family serine protease|nr:rhomboid family intramembrane serine protease [Crocinitomicaceae bacterium]
MADFFTTYQARLKAKDTRIILLTINLAVFLLFTVLSIAKAENVFYFLVEEVFSFKTDSTFFLTHPWTVVTSIFTHFSFTHILFNMLMFYFVSEMFVYFFSARKLVWIYLLGGIAGNLFEFLANLIVYSNEQPISVIGASGSVMAVFIAVAIYQPHLKVKLFGLLDMKIIYLAAVYFLLDFTQINSNDGVAHLAHIGGALIGFLSARNVTKPSNILNYIDTLWTKITAKKPKKKKVVYGGRPMNDEQFNTQKKANQDRIDAILDKISKKGYDGLTAEEKDFLFNQSNKR